MPSRLLCQQSIKRVFFWTHWISWLSFFLGVCTTIVLLLFPKFSVRVRCLCDNIILFTLPGLCLHIQIWWTVLTVVTNCRFKSLSSCSGSILPGSHLAAHSSSIEAIVSLEILCTLMQISGSMAMSTVRSSWSYLWCSHITLWDVISFGKAGLHILQTPQTHWYSHVTKLSILSASHNIHFPKGLHPRFYPL